MAFAPRTSLRFWLQTGVVLLFALAEQNQTREPAWPGLSSHRQLSASSSPRSLFASGLSLNSSSESQTGTTPEQFQRDEAAIRSQPLCIASRTWSCGTMGDVVLFTHRRSGDELKVGYFVYWSAERPWGKNLLTYSVFPALLIDATYSHFLFVLPGVREFMYGAGDIEGAAVVYRQSGERELSPEFGFADDDTHHPVELSRSDLATASGRVVLMTNVWSHQLGARGAAAYSEADPSQVRCFSGDALQPISSEVAQRFRLGSSEHPLRARPAWSVNARLRAAPSG